MEGASGYEVFLAALGADQGERLLVDLGQEAATGNLALALVFVLLGAPDNRRFHIKPILPK
jgi:hypothetical protein